LPEPLIQSLRHMATRLACEGNLPPRLSFVAALRQEGVTLVSQAFATMLAHDTGRRVCYVDLNWWWPSPHMHTLNTQTPGVAGVLKGETTWQRALIHTTRLNLNLLPAGLLSPAQRPSFARRPALGAMLDEINRQHDFVILDIPALQASTDAVPLASLGKASCVVIRQGGSTRNAVCAALAGLHHMPIVGVAMNRVRIATPNWLLKWIPQG